MHKPKLFLLLIASFICVKSLKAQDSFRLDKLISFPDKAFGALDKKASSIEEKLDKQTDKYLSKLERQEERLKKILWKKDTTLAKQLFDGSKEKYEALKKQSGKVSKYSSVYSGHLDSLTTSLNFLQDQNLASSPELQKTLEQYKALQSKLNASDQVKKYLTQRRELLKEQFEKLGMVKELKKFRKEVYYYQAQVKEYKEIFEDPSKMEAKLLEVAMKLPQFRDFFQKNSLLGSLFALPGNSSGSTASIEGLQTRQMVNQSLIDRFGSSSNVTQQLQQNVQSAQGELNQLKSKLSSYSSGSYGNGDPDIPGFKPNDQKTKSFLKRLEYGSNLQTDRARYFFPVTTNIGLSLGYKINDKSIVGIGASYMLGLGRGWDHLKLTHQGIGVRSYLDWKIKGQLYISGGYEQNYKTLITSIDQLRDYSSWQKSGLIGLSKRYSVSKKLKGEMKIMWDFLSYQQVPKGQPIVFRVGYSFK